MLVKWRDIFLWRMFYYSNNTIGTKYRIVNEACAPSVAVFHVCKINSIAFLYFANKYAIVNNYGIVGVMSYE